MKIKITINHLIITILLLVFYRLYLFKFIYLLIIPGLVFLLFFRDYDLKKSFIFSYPLSLILYIYPYFLLTRAGIPINSFLYLLIPGLLIFYYISKKEVSVSFKSTINVKQLIISGLILSVFFIIYSPFSFRNMVALTEATNDLRAVIDIKNNIIAHGLVPRWGTGIFSGNHYFYTYPPLSQLSISLLSLIPTEPIHVTFNLSYTLPIIYLLFAVYFLFRKLKLSSVGSGIATLLIAGVPMMAGQLAYTGNSTSAFMFSLYPVALYGFFSLFEKSKKSDMLVYSISLAAFFLVYHFMFYFFLLSALATCIIYLLIKREKYFLKNCLIYFGFAGLIVLSWLVFYLGVINYVDLMSLEGKWTKPFEDLSEFISYLTYNGGIVDREALLKRVSTFTPLFFYLGIISSLLVFRYKKTKKKSFTFENLDLVMLAYSLFVFFLIIVEIFPFHVYIPLRTKFYRAFRYLFTLVPLLAFGIGRLVDNIKAYYKKSTMILLVVFPLLFTGMFIFSFNNVYPWIAERSIVDRSLLEVIYNFLETKQGRIAVYGEFGPAIIPAFSRWTDRSMFAGYNFERYATKNYYQKMILPITRGSQDYLHSNVLPIRVYNTYKKAWVTDIVFFTCKEKGYKAFNKTNQYPFYETVAEGECLDILGLNNSFVKQVYLSRVEGNKSFVIDQVMNTSNGYKLVFTVDELNETYTNIVSDSNLSNYVTNSTDLFWRRISDDEIIINARPGYVLIKEPYFPNWHAYQSGNKLKIFPSYHGFIIIKSESLGEIKIVNQPLFVEYIGLLIFILAIALLYYALVNFD